MRVLRTVRRMGAATAVAALLAGAASGLAADTGSPHAAARAPVANPTSPYAGLENRRLKAMSAAQIDDLLAGRGMGLALAAELNGYPGPAHVLELMRDLSLTPGQVAAATALRTEMAREARRLGAEIVKRETDLDRSFAAGAAAPESLRRTLADLARLQGELRFVHLAAHLSMREILFPEQVAAYARLRGYDGPDTMGRDPRRHHMKR